MNRTKKLLLLLVFVFFISSGTFLPARAAAPSILDVHSQGTVVDRALQWVLAQQNDDGSFPSTWDAVGMSLDAVFAGAAAGVDVSNWRTDSANPSVLDFLAANVDAYATDAAKAGKLLAAIVAAGQDPWSFGNRDLVALLLGYQLADGTFGTSVTANAWAILGLVAARESVPEAAIAFLEEQQAPNGGWDSGWGIDTNTTSLVLQALLAAGKTSSDSVIQKGLAYLATQQSESGGFVFSTDFGTEADANSTAYCLQALIAAGENPFSSTWCREGHSPFNALLGFQLPSGAFVWKESQGEENLSATLQAIPAVLGKPFPLSGVVPALRDAVAYLRGMQEDDGSFPSGFSARAAMSLAALGEDLYQWKGAGGTSLLEYLETEAARVNNVGVAGRLAAALAMAKANPYLAGDVNLIAYIKRAYQADTGAFDRQGNVWNHSLALWGLYASGEPIPPEAVAWLKSCQNEDGGWGWAVGGASDSNSTALAIETLLACGVAEDDPVITHALDYLRSLQLGDGGFPWDATGTASDADSTALAIQAIVAAGEDPSVGWNWARTISSTEEITITVRKPLDRLLALQRPSGAFEWLPGTGDNLLSTIEALPALVARPFPWQSPTIKAAQKAIAWIKDQQQEDGSFPAAFGHPAGITLDVIMAGIAAGEDVSAWRQGAGGASPLDYLASVVDEYATSASTTGKLIVGVVAAGRDPTVFGQCNLIERLLSYESEGAFGTTSLDQAWALLALAAAKRPIDQSAIDVLLGLQQEDGGWESGPGWGTDTNTTGLALQALIAAGVDPSAPAIDRALSYLKSQQSSSGGFTYSTAWGTEADANSTALSIQGLFAAGESPFAQQWQKGEQGPVDALLAFQLESGAFEWKPGQGENLLATAQAVPAILLEVYPLREVSFVHVWLPWLP